MGRLALLGERRPMTFSTADFLSKYTKIKSWHGGIIKIYGHVGFSTESRWSQEQYRRNFSIRRIERSFNMPPITSPASGKPERGGADPVAGLLAPTRRVFLTMTAAQGIALPAACGVLFNSAGAASARAAEPASAPSSASGHKGAFVRSPHRMGPGRGSSVISRIPGWN